MIWNGDCSVPDCAREVVGYDGLCRKHRWPYDTPVGELPHLPMGVVLAAVVGIALCGVFGLCVLVLDILR